MKYAIVRLDGVTEIRQSAAMPEGAIELTDEQHAGLLSGALAVINGQVVTAPPPTAAELAARAAAIAQAQADADAKAAVKADATAQYIRDHTPAEVDAYILTAVADLPPSARQMFRKMGQMLCALSKQSLR